MKKLNVHLFGAATPTGQSLVNQLANASFKSHLYAYSRGSKVNYVDFAKPAKFVPSGDIKAPSIWINFGPIWLFSPFLEHLASKSPECLAGIHGLIACSSSSALTKRFAFNAFDRELVSLLNTAENQLLKTCQRLKIPCRILQPTLIYGQVGDYGDRNLSRILHQLRRLPFLPLPAQAGLRQPIHASQLSAVALHIATQFSESSCQQSLPDRIALGGDTTLTYYEMIRDLQQAQYESDPARRCRLMSIPSRLFFLLAAPLLLSSPKAFEAVLRMGANLSGFTPAHQLLGSEPKRFPVQPLS